MIYISLIAPHDVSGIPHTSSHVIASDGLCLYSVCDLVSECINMYLSVSKNLYCFIGPTLRLCGIGVALSAETETG